MQIIEVDECVRLLRRGGIGRIAIVMDDTPSIRPVNFAFDGERVVIRTGDTVLAEAGERGAAAQLEVDEIDPFDHTGWSVIVTGHVTGDSGGVSPANAPVQPWAPGDRGRLVVLTPASISGRRLGPVAAAPVGESPGDGRDTWGRSESARRSTRRVVEPLYRWWFRMSWTGLERIPRRGGVLLVANHAGVIPVDATLIMHGLERELDRPVFALHHHGLREVPYLGTALAANGGVVAHPDNALRLLRDEQQVVLVFPEGTKGTRRLYRDRYRLARFGRGGFIETAMRAGVPIVPIVVVGAEEAMPTMFRIPVSRRLQLPVTLNALLLGPLGAVVQFPVSISAHVLDPISFDQPAGLEEYPASEVAAATEVIRSDMQRELDRRISHGGRHERGG
jgi:1-acyl-sn-glycerol-3-phosphate acyltransferase